MFSNYPWMLAFYPEEKDMRTINTIQQKEPSAELRAGTPTESTEPARVNQHSTNTPTVQPHSRDHTMLEKCTLF